VEKPSGPDDVWSKFAMSIFDLNGLLMRAGESIVRPLGQSSARWQVLGRAFQPQTVATMARDMGRARQSVQRVADVLAQEGLVIYRDHPTDRRTKLVELTPRGLEVLTAIYERQLEWSRSVTATLIPAQLSSIVKGLSDIKARLEAEIDLGAKAVQPR
jgi:DNA-binding MarR family transcriptional regulator